MRYQTHYTTIRKLLQAPSNYETNIGIMLHMKSYPNCPGAFGI